MFKRLFFATVGLGAGVAIGVWAVKKVEEAQAKLSPEHAARVTAARAEGFRARLTEAIDAGRLAAAEKEAELRAVYRVREQRLAEAENRPTS
jgi:hypothetical protein